MIYKQRYEILETRSIYETMAQCDDYELKYSTEELRMFVKSLLAESHVWERRKQTTSHQRREKLKEFTYGYVLLVCKFNTNAFSYSIPIVLHVCV